MVGQSNMLSRAQKFTLAAVATTLLVGAAVAQAKQTYDGNWSVLITTDKGSCDRAYRYPVRIANGVVGYAGQASFQVSGRVQANGAISVRVSRGSQSANGTGRLNGTSGGGSWRGGECSGTWTAEKR
ncbi:hypothetical protein GJW-30_1_02243 [Variibacter gotjawalensis]|uniref:Large exoprotein involved in heme utilization or adhesion n=1 Tax=Variibacter gotjawalensis TaxID=1333996 RepID=A0A0S3PV59_9BRAD|nr:hypothetical protein [Variibacter gotjawalensis]NIK50036.1 putative membrane protein YgcG [Variibacter gotjawalensis]RZS46035.1 hypothetical protein EV661_4361 [Variibacter gotjawalensis]BAT59710.1 hypothetical protein GJW-30_1_02243 [Variibacter gotjawalensis]